MPPRNTRPDCPTCRQPATSEVVVKTLAITSDTEAERLWRHVLTGTCGCLSIAESYVELNMPGDPTNMLRGIRDRIDKLISHFEQPVIAPATEPTPEPAIEPSPEPATEINKEVSHEG